MKKHSAFSLIELSIVILIIGILIAGITQSSRLVKQARLKTARTLTQSSPVAGIADLLLWYETSLASSFDDAEQSDGTEITTWYDNNPQTISKNNASLDNGDGGTVCSSNPKFYENVFNSGIPAVRFNGLNGTNNSSTDSTGNCLRFNGADLVENNYTLFVVEQLRATADQQNMGFFGGTANNSYKNLFFGYNYTSSNNPPTGVKIDYYSGGLTYYDSIFTYNTPTPRIHSARFSTTDGTSYWLNGGADNKYVSNSSRNIALREYSGASLGRTNTNGVYKYFIGDLAEVIIFTRALKTEERQAIEDYLSKKYGISIS